MVPSASLKPAQLHSMFSKFIVAPDKIMPLARPNLNSQTGQRLPFFLTHWSKQFLWNRCLHSSFFVDIKSLGFLNLISCWHIEHSPFLETSLQTEKMMGNQQNTIFSVQIPPETGVCCCDFSEPFSELQSRLKITLNFSKANPKIATG